MPCPFPIFSQSDYLIQVVDINSNNEWPTVQIQMSWLLKKPADLDLHCLQRQGISGFSRTRVKVFIGVFVFFSMETNSERKTSCVIRHRLRLIIIGA